MQVRVVQVHPGCSYRTVHDWVRHCHGGLPFKSHILLDIIKFTMLTGGLPLLRHPHWIHVQQTLDHFQKPGNYLCVSFARSSDSEDTSLWVCTASPVLEIFTQPNTSVTILAPNHNFVIGAPSPILWRVAYLFHCFLYFFQCMIISTVTTK